MSGIIIILLVLSFGVLGIVSYAEYKEDKEKVQKLGQERAELVDQVYKLCQDLGDMGFDVKTQQLINYLQTRIWNIEQEIEELNDKWM